MGHNGRAGVALPRKFGKNASDYGKGLQKYWEELVDSFNRTAIMAPCTEEPAGTLISTVGGTIRSIIVDPETGVTVKTEQPEITAVCGRPVYEGDEVGEGS